MIRFGKHKGSCIRQVKKKDPQYVVWLMAQPWFHEKNADLVAALEDRKMLCLSCGKGMAPIGYARANGKCHADWGSREYHKSCWKELQTVSA